jgi:FMN phosphatase YigB (HAD superfamily)
MIKMILFDLDGTLLPMDLNVFVKAYFGGIAKRLAARGYQADSLISAIRTGTAAMIKNDGKQTNEQVFWDKFAQLYGENAKSDEPYFEEFYRLDFDKVQVSCGYNPKAAEAVNTIKQMGFRVALATNPIFPAIATQKRIAWAGLTPGDFELYTTYENSHYCKPNLAYYQEVISALGVSAEECLMVGNDVSEDMIAKQLGMKVFLLTDCLINKDEADISVYPNGSFDQLLEYVKTL